MRSRGAAVFAPLSAAILLASLPAPAGGAASASRETLDKVAFRPAGIEAVVDRVVAEVAAQVKSHKTLVCWLLDSTRVTQQMNLLPRLAARVETAFAPMGAAWKDKAFLAVCSMGGSQKPAAVLSPVSPELTPALQAIRELGTMPDDTYKNALDAIRRVAQAMTTFSGRRILVLVTFENGDTEDNLEETLLHVQKCACTIHVVSREALYSDPFFEVRLGGLRSYYASYGLELPYELTGTDAPTPEYPNGWIFDRSGIHDVVPSGYGTYALSRLAFMTGGTYAILHPEDPGVLPFCAEAGCAICEGTHGGCDAFYDPARLALVAPSLLPRDAYRADLGKVALARAFFESWQIAYDAGLCAMPPPWEVKGGTLNPRPARSTRAPQQPRPLPAEAPEPGTPWTSWGYDALTHGGMGVPNDAKLDEIFRDCDKAIATLENAVRTAGLPKPSIRLVAAAETLLCQLYATRLNLGQFRIVRDDLKATDHPLSSAQTLNGFALPALAETRRRTAESWKFDYRNLRFCHGADRVRDICLLGGAPVRKEQMALCERVDRALQKYQGSPWEILIRRIGVVLLRPIAVPPPPPPDPLAPKPDKKPKASDPGPPPPRPPFAPPVRPPRPFRGSTVVPGGVPPAPGADPQARPPALTPSNSR